MYFRKNLTDNYLTISSNIRLFITGENFINVRGLIIVEAENSSCHLSAASQPYAFSDEDQVLEIYPWSLTSNLSCTWNFLGPISYGFKVVFEQYQNV